MHPVLVRLKDFEVTQMSKKFGEAQFEFKKEFLKSVSLAKASQETLTLPVFWFRNSPYTFLQITPTGPKVRRDQIYNKRVLYNGGGTRSATYS